MLKKIFMPKSKLFQRLPILRTYLFIRGKSDEKLKCKSKNPVPAVPKHLNYTFLTMDDMPVPTGSWKEFHAKKNKYYNRILLLGITSLITSITILWKNVFFNAFPPPYPFDEVEYECVPKSKMSNINDEDE